MDKTHILNVCKLGQEGQCCKYLCMDKDGFFCAKLNKDLKTEIDSRSATMAAKGDNCEGLDETLHVTEIQ